MSNAYKSTVGMHCMNREREREREEQEDLRTVGKILVY
jgi:hypothetical protein